VTTGAPWRTCPGRSIVCGCSLRVRKWFCRNRACPRRIFTERLPTIAAPWARRTLRLGPAPIASVWRWAGKPGAPRSRVDVRVSRNTPSCACSAGSRPSFPTPRVLGVDDFPCGSRQNLWHDPGRPRAPSAGGLAPGGAPPRGGAVAAGASRVEDRPGSGQCVCRGRASRGPCRTQVADRFHCVRISGETLDESSPRPPHHDALTAVNARWHQQPVPLPDGDAGGPGPTASHPAPRRTAGAQRAAQATARYRARLDPPPPGLARVALPPKWAAAVAPSKRILHRRLGRCGSIAALWTQHPQPVSGSILSAGTPACHTAIHLFRELQLRGYTGSYRRCHRVCQPPLPGPGHPTPPPGPAQLLPVVAEPVSQPDVPPGDVARPPP